MSDLFHPEVPWDFILAVFSVMEATPHHVYQVLTKRPGRMAYFADYILTLHGRQWPTNVWAGTSVESQKYVSRLKLLERIPAKVRFASVEPLLEDINLLPWLQNGMLRWVIVGGESGPGAREIRLEWVYSLKAQCDKTNVPLFVKQLGTAWASSKRLRDGKAGDPSCWPENIRVREFPSMAGIPRELVSKLQSVPGVI